LRFLPHKTRRRFQFFDKLTIVLICIEGQAFRCPEPIEGLGGKFVVNFNQKAQKMQKKATLSPYAGFLVS
jgi:hypothetical protein